MLKSEDGKATSFTKYMTEHWRDVLSNLDGIAPTIRQKHLILAACEALPPGDYLLFLEKLVELSHSPGFNVKIWNGVIVTTRYKRGFLEYNYENGRVAAVIGRINAMIPADDPLRPEIQDIASGLARQRFLEDDSDLTEADLARIVLQP